MAEHSPRPSFWWFRCLLISGVIFAAGLIGFHWWLTRHVDMRLARIVDGWRLDPEAPLPEMLEIGSAGIATGKDNAAFHYQAAMQGLPPLTPSQQAEWDERLPPVRVLQPEKVQIVREIVAACESQLRVARQARSLERIDWNLPAVSKLSSANWIGLQQLAYRQLWAMSLAHHDGDIASAVDFARDALALTSAGALEGPSLSTGGTSASVEGTVVRCLTNTVWYRSPGLTPEQERAKWREARPQVQSLIADLLDEESSYEQMALSWKGERVVAYSALAVPRGWNAMPSWDAPVSALGIITIRPAIRAELVRILEAENRMIAAVEARDPLAMREAAVDAPPEPRSIAGRLAGPLAQVAWPSMRQYRAESGRAIALRGIVAVVLASKVHHADTGQWPQAWSDLVPRYLPHIPKDPFSPAGAPLAFRIETPLPIVYSIDEDLQDDGGSTEQAEDTIYRRKDLVYPLHLPSDPLVDDEEFDVWNWLLSPEGERERLEQLGLEKERWSRRAASRRALEPGVRDPGVD